MSIRLAPLALALAAALAACGTAQADRLALEHRPDIVPRGLAPYEVELIDALGRPLDTYQHRGRFYVRGDAGERYSIRVTNPTDRRVEAVISVDGLDVVDGETASFSKRGYVIPPGGTVEIDGFRTSTTQVAAFRFSSVANSYAGRKGKARHVGVIGVALFAERAQPVMVLPEARVDPPAPPRYQPYGRDYDDGVSAGAARTEEAAPAPAESRARAPRRTAAADSAAGARHKANIEGEYSGRVGAVPPRYRPGLGTEFGERRYSAVSWTRFQRATPRTPTAMAELRYNDASGLRALGIHLGPTVDEREIVTRETANPFPNEDRRFALPPR